MKNRLLLLIFLLTMGTTGEAAESTDQWLVTTDLWGNATYQLLELPDDEGPLTGVFDGDPLKGSRQGQTLEFVVTGSDSAVYRFSGTQTQEQITGVADYPDTNSRNERATHAFTARRLPQRANGAPQRHEFVPSQYSNEFSPHRTPVLTLWPGDSLHTTTLDSGGVDQHGKTQALFGNPQTGPFYVMGAEPGDVLVIRIKRLRLNRDYADSLDSLVGRALSPALAAKATELGKPVRWKLDLERSMAHPESPSPHLQNLSVPMRPMLGGLAVAPGFGSAPISTGDTGRFGGNMDFNEIREGATVYLPVSQPGALLYLGDAHALQGDGETSQYGLETSMDVEIDVDVIHRKNIATPRVESDTQIMALGQAGSLDDALRAATSGMVQWLQQDHGLTLSECAQVMGSSVHYVVANLAGRSVGMAAKLDKSVLRTLSPEAGAEKSDKDGPVKK